MKKEVDYRFEGTKEMVGNMGIVRLLPTTALRDINPLLLIDVMGPKEFQAGEAMHVDVHPHGGMQTLTYFFDGGGLHRDSLGNEQLIEAGDANWMVAGDGIIHEEWGHPNIEENGGLVHGVQIWINLPQVKRRIAPEFHFAAKATLPFSKHGGSELRLIAGALGDLQSPIHLYNNIQIVHFKMHKDSVMAIPVSEGNRSALFTINGRIGIHDKAYSSGGLLLLKDEGTIAEWKALDEGVEGIYFSMEPLKEPYQSYGPFIGGNSDDLKYFIEKAQQKQMGKMRMRLPKK